MLYHSAKACGKDITLATQPRSNRSALEAARQKNSPPAVIDVDATIEPPESSAIAKGRTPKRAAEPEHADIRASKRPRLAATKVMSKAKSVDHSKGDGSSTEEEQYVHHL